MPSVLEWLAATPWSVALHESHYAFLAVLTTHVMTLSVFAGMALIIDLRLLGLAMLRVPASELVSRLVPWAVAGLVVMIVTGLLLFYASPVDRYGNLFFRTKMGLLAAAGLNVWIFHSTVYTRVADWERDRVPPRGARVAGGLGLVLWAGIVVAGRMIPYQQYWF
ncbi:MAG TPA: DUF6644 family protein [Gammaproteobacteria bacterium]|nr:DUF6644 family protein [Gammaproteobacteria bacterium]